MTHKHSERVGVPSHNAAMVTLIFVDGNISRGKSTLCKNGVENPYTLIDKLQSHKVFRWVAGMAPTVVVAAIEDTDQWKTPDGRSLLQLIGVEPKTYMLEFQKCVVLTRIQTIAQAIYGAVDGRVKNIVVLCDGSMHVDFLYTMRARNNNNLTEAEMTDYSRYWSCLMATWMEELEVESLAEGRKIEIHVGGTLFMEPDADLVLQRLHDRNRPGEEFVTKDYLTEMDQMQALAFASECYPFRPVIRINDAANPDDLFDFAVPAEPKD